MTALGRLQRIPDLGATWPDEARDVAPWLAREKNVALLAGLPSLGPDGLQLETVERFVAFRRAARPLIAELP